MTADGYKLITIVLRADRVPGGPRFSLPSLSKIRLANFHGRDINFFVNNRCPVYDPATYDDARAALTLARDGSSNFLADVKTCKPAEIRNCGIRFFEVIRRAIREIVCQFYAREFEIFILLV